MKIIKETNASIVNLDCEFSDDEITTLLNYAINNIPRETCINLLLEWAFVNILNKQVDIEIKKIKGIKKTEKKPASKINFFGDNIREAIKVLKKVKRVKK